MQFWDSNRYQKPLCQEGTAQARFSFSIWLYLVRYFSSSWWSIWIKCLRYSIYYTYEELFSDKTILRKCQSPSRLTAAAPWDEETQRAWKLTDLREDLKRECVRVWTVYLPGSYRFAVLNFLCLLNDLIQLGEILKVKGSQTMRTFALQSKEATVRVWVGLRRSASQRNGSMTRSRILE